REDRERPNDLAGLGILPAGPQAGERERLAVGPDDGVWRPDLAVAAPLVERVDGDEAAALSERIPEGRVPVDRLCPGVEHPVARLGRFGPVRDQSPAIG